MAGNQPIPGTAERSAAARSGSRMMHGGFVDAVQFAPTERMMFDALIDTLIPPEDDWPGAAEIGVVDLASRYLVPDDFARTFYPYFRASEFRAILSRFGSSFSTADLHERVAVLEEFENREAALFARIREFVSYVYYGHPRVVGVIRARTRHGGRYTGHSQPTGYREILEGWGDRRPASRGAFIPTAAVRPVRAGKDS